MFEEAYDMGYQSALEKLSGPLGSVIDQTLGKGTAAAKRSRSNLAKKLIDTRKEVRHSAEVMQRSHPSQDPLKPLATKRFFGSYVGKGKEPGAADSLITGHVPYRGTPKGVTMATPNKAGGETVKQIDTSNPELKQKLKQHEPPEVPLKPKMKKAASYR